MLASAPPKDDEQVSNLSKLVIATRESRLALWQAEHVKALLEERGH
ncbi:MAG: Porphobilinogen deaminase, partial [Ramlibacter sp.]|nr:Porphobilinogen deaminase [Ramlibacter sp.]